MQEAVEIITTFSDCTQEKVLCESPWRWGKQGVRAKPAQHPHFFPFITGIPKDPRKNTGGPCLGWAGLLVNYAFCIYQPWRIRHMVLMLLA
jgi:hypothetical protein